METDIAGNGEEALYKLKQKDFGVILLDLHMPGVDGMDVLREVRKIRPDIGVIIITAYGTVELAVEAMKTRCCGFLQKPFVPGEIREMVARVIDRKKLDGQRTADYASSIEFARNASPIAISMPRQNTSEEPSLSIRAAAEAFNLLGSRDGDSRGSQRSPEELPGGPFARSVLQTCDQQP